MAFIIEKITLINLVHVNLLFAFHSFGAQSGFWVSHDAMMSTAIVT